MVTKTGNEFPARTSAEYAGVLANALRLELGASHRAVKTLRQWTDASERTAKHWLAGTHGPSGHHLIALVKHSDTVLQAVLSLSERKSYQISSSLPSIRTNLLQAVDLIDECLASGEKGAIHR